MTFYVDGTVLLSFSMEQKTMTLEWTCGKVLNKEPVYTHSGTLDEEHSQKSPEDTVQSHSVTLF